MAQPPQSTQTEVQDYFVANTGFHLCRQCKNVRQGAWSFTGLCSYCVPLPAGGFRTDYSGQVAALDLMPPDYSSRGVWPPANSVPHLALGFVPTFANPISFAPMASRAWG